jgi:hypothetical protein
VFNSCALSSVCNRSPLSRLEKKSLKPNDDKYFVYARKENIELVIFFRLINHVLETLFFYEHLCKLIDYNCESRKNQSQMVIARFVSYTCSPSAINLRFQFLPLWWSLLFFSLPLSCLQIFGSHCYTLDLKMPSVSAEP